MPGRRREPTSVSNCNKRSGSAAPLRHILQSLEPTEPNAALHLHTGTVHTNQHALRVVATATTIEWVCMQSEAACQASSQRAVHSAAACTRTPGTVRRALTPGTLKESGVVLTPCPRMHSEGHDHMKQSTRGTALGSSCRVRWQSESIQHQWQLQHHHTSRSSSIVNWKNRSCMTGKKDGLRHQPNASASMLATATRHPHTEEEDVPEKTSPPVEGKRGRSTGMNSLYRT